MTQKLLIGYQLRHDIVAVAQTHTEFSLNCMDRMLAIVPFQWEIDSYFHRDELNYE